MLAAAAGVVTVALAGIDDWLPPGEQAGQYALDLVADGPVCALLVAAGFGVLSEESGLHHPERAIVVVVDPVDGSTNASRRIPHYNTSLCAVDADGPLAALVVNQASGERFDAVRGGGARCDGLPIRPSAVTALDHALVAFNGLPDRHWGWDQYRAFGAAALDLCAVACGRLDGYVDAMPSAHGPWDYLGGLLICAEAGAVVTDADGRELVVLEHGARRTPVAAGTPELHATLAAMRGSDTAGP
ncbi:MAG: inositol monophosphatase/fructose,6-bisphosphatase family protein [Actinomycetia bacterium]|nr:inositol monophosphatase/fructose,6-bisphosphatase family protein [Actinomycetes bacterium]